MPDTLSTQEPLHSRRVVVLAGGVGGARMAAGLAQCLPPDRLTVIVNTGDDFDHLGLRICPDLDTVMYTLGGVANEETGWGRAGESWRTLEAVGELGGPTWFRLGDLDLGTHLTRTHLLSSGETLTAATDHLRRHLGIEAALLPMSDEPAPTMIETPDGILPFQTWFVARQWQPAVNAVRLPDNVRATPQVMTALEKADVVVIAPSNPFVSIDPILNVYPLRAMITDLPEIVVAVSPIIQGAALKGPAARMMQDKGLPVAAQGILDYYDDLIDLFVYDQRDEGQVQTDKHELFCTDTIMHGPEGRARLARELLQFVEELLNA